MVFVRHSEQPEIKVTRYDGTIDGLHRPAAPCADALERAHAELAERVRARGDDAETFDPQRDFPQAIRRVDVGLPAPQLASRARCSSTRPACSSRCASATTA